jgi:hypothetical protein
MIELTSYPPISGYGFPDKIPVPVSDCLQWCMQPDDEDVTETAGSGAFVQVVFPNTFTPPANGTAFKIWGIDFTFDGTYDYTSNSFDSDGEANPARNNFARMIEANLFFRRAVFVHRVGNNTALISWLNCEEQANFTGANLVMTAFTSLGATVTSANGVSPVYVPGYQITVQLMKLIGNTGNNAFKAITALTGLQPKKNCSGADEMCVNLMAEARKTLFTPMPDLTDSSEIDPQEQNMTGRFLLAYGWAYRTDDCQTMTGTIRQSDEAFVINSAFEVDDPGQIDPFWYPDSSPNPMRFLTNQPKTMHLSLDSKAWVWLTSNYLDDFPTFTGFALRITTYKVGVAGVYATDFEYYNSCEWWQVKNMNVSPGRVLTVSGLTAAELERYTVLVFPVDDDQEPLNFGTEELNFVIERQCENTTDVYFVTPPGGIGTLLVTKIGADVEQSGNEICMDTPCATTFVEKAKYGGRSLSNVRAYDRITVRAVANYTEEDVDYFRSFKASAERWIRVPYGSGWMARKFIIEPGAVKIFQTGERIELEATGYLGDIPLQAPKNN